MIVQISATLVKGKARINFKENEKVQCKFFERFFALVAGIKKYEFNYNFE